MGIGEAQSLTGQAVDMWSLYPRGTVAAHVAIAQVVGVDEYYIWSAGLRLSSEAESGEKEEKQEDVESAHGEDVTEAGLGGNRPVGYLRTLAWRRLAESANFVRCAPVSISSLTLVLAAVDAAPETVKSFLDAGAAKGILFALASILAGIVANWLSSILFAAERATLLKAFVMSLAMLGAGVVVGVIFAVGMPLLARGVGPAAVMVFAVGVLVFFVGLLVLVPMKIYQIGALRSVGLIAIAWFLGFGFHLGLATVMPAGEVKALQRGATQFFEYRLSLPRNREAELNDLRRRQAELMRRHGLLTIQYRHMPLSDVQTVRTYVRERKAYERDLEVFKGDLARASQ